MRLRRRVRLRNRGSENKEIRIYGNRAAHPLIPLPYTW